MVSTDDLDHSPKKMYALHTQKAQRFLHFNEKVCTSYTERSFKIITLSQTYEHVSLSVLMAIIQVNLG